VLSPLNRAQRPVGILFFVALFLLTVATQRIEMPHSTVWHFSESIAKARVMFPQSALHGTLPPGLNSGAMGRRCGGRWRIRKVDLREMNAFPLELRHNLPAEAHQR
jgi:hypothetical protein